MEPLDLPDSLIVPITMLSRSSRIGGKRFAWTVFMPGSSSTPVVQMGDMIAELPTALAITVGEAFSAPDTIPSRPPV